MSKSHTHTRTFYLLGERLCLDFANTVSWHAGENPEEWLTDYEKLIVWSVDAGITTNKKMTSLLQTAGRHPERVQCIHRQAIELREAIYRIFRDIAHDKIVNSDDLAILNVQLASAYQHVNIMSHNTHTFSISFKDEGDALDGIFWPIVQSAIDLLTSEDLYRVKQCEGGACGWLFLDTSRNRSRRWCSMEDCGNREKARRFYRKKRREQ